MEPEKQSEPQPSNPNSSYPNAEEPMKNPDIVIVGAGPVGLWISIKMKYAEPETKIVIYERYTEYQRKNMIKLSKKDKFEIPKGSAMEKIFKNEIISIMDIESILQGEAKRLGVQIIFEKIEDFDKLYERHSDVKLWIGADGAHSALREKWYGFEVHDPICNIVQVQYETFKEPSTFELWKKYALMKKVDCLVEETTNGSKVTVRFTVPDNLYEPVKDHRAKNPIKMLDDIKDEKLHWMIEFWLKARSFYLDEYMKPDTLTIHSFQLDTYRSQSYTHQNKNGLFALCGDSAFGVPYYRSMRNGWVAANNLVKIYLKRGRFIEEYQEYMRKFFDEEKERAKKKSSIVDTASEVMKLESKNPLSLLQLWDFKYDQIMKQDIYAGPDGSGQKKNWFQKTFF